MGFHTLRGVDDLNKKPEKIKYLWLIMKVVFFETEIKLTSEYL